MKITGTRSYIDVEIDGKSIRISGELTTTPVFFANADSIQNWNPPNDSQPITDGERAQLIKIIVEERKRGGYVPVVFD